MCHSTAYQRERENENELWEEKSILRVSEMRSGLGLCRGKTGEDRQENVGKEVGDLYGCESWTVKKAEC